MDDSKNFSYADLTALESISGTISKMNEVLDGVKEFFERKIGPFAKESSRSTRLKEDWYVATRSVGKVFKFEIEVGFIWWWNEEVYVGIRIYLPTSAKYKNTENYCKFFKKHLKDWEFDDDGDCSFSKSKPVGQFIIDEEEQVPAMIQYLMELIDELEALKKVDSDIFK